MNLKYGQKTGFSKNLVGTGFTFPIQFKFLFIYGTDLPSLVSNKYVYIILIFMT